MLARRSTPASWPRVTGRPAEQVAAGLDAAVRAGVLTAVPDAPGRRRFAHAVVRDAVYADLAPSVREELHRRAAEALELLAADDDAAAGLVAGHWLRAAAGPEASAPGGRVGAPGRGHGDPPARLRRGRPVPGHGRAGRRTGRADGGGARGAAGRAGDGGVPGRPPRRGAGALPRRLRRRRGRRAARPAGRRGAGRARRQRPRPSRRPWCGCASGPSPRVDADRSPALRSRLLSQAASALADAGRLGAAAGRAAEALDLARRCGSPEAVIDAVRARMKASPTALDVGRAAGPRPAGDRARRPGRASRWRSCGARSGGSTPALEIGDMDVVTDELARVSALAARTRLPLVRWHDLRLRASVTALLGRFPEAVTLNEEARVLGATELPRGPLGGRPVRGVRAAARPGHRRDDRLGRRGRREPGPGRRHPGRRRHPRARRPGPGAAGPTPRPGTRCCAGG